MDPPPIDHDANPTPQSAKKRKPRPRLSCVVCRQKKLKCDRLYPCDNCIKHNRTYLCHYAGPTVMSRKQSQGIQDHLRKLEVRLEQLSAVDEPSQVPGFTHHASQNNPAGVLQPQPGPHIEKGQSELEKDYPGTILIEQNGTRYMDPTHWRAVLDQIAEVKEYLELTEDTSPEEEFEEDSPSLPISGPVLLFGNTASTTKANLLAAVPDRSAADRLVSLYLNSKESTLVIMHIPTFTKEYSEFWKNPEDVTINWLAFLFSILCAGTGLQLFSTFGRVDGELVETFDEYHRLASQCLCMSDYTKPGLYKMETLILSVAMEILRSTDTHVGPSILLGLASRLAMHGGYHRDPKHYREISIFDGEMRRRVWMCLSLLDHYISLQGGLPPTTIQAQSDTEEPRNLTDEDLNPLATTLPLARPPTENTPILFPTMLNRIMFTDAEIISKVCSVKGVPYREVLRLDAKLKELHNTVPPPLQFRPLSESIADSPNMIMDRYNINLMYQKARCDLHRRYLAQHRLDPAYAYSRRECLDAARTVLQHQFDIFDASSSGGQLGYTSFFFSPIVAVHFRSAAMIVSLEISCKSRYDLRQRLTPSERQSILAERQQLSGEIERACAIWKQLCHQSKEAMKTAEALQIMLKITHNHLQHGETPEQEQDARSNLDSQVPSEISFQDANPAFVTPTPPVPYTNVENEYSPLDVDLMDATFYLGQDAISDPTKTTNFAGSTDVVDFYDRYWDNLMLLGDEQPFTGMTFDGSNQGSSETGVL
ncbi:hypothetical protein BGW36DRAFT_378310 [Talaromyces proteolyticus]|uniref:Zn(2)-C6 fungal-type domain-containing protein n=1 Tax=Talaromyces proteolyticus TaxID=1131652 RepID=A0AAD4KQR3_9EURO|nr:uncharacterized protein BGW36DRAFT_378310 [Talaromyces proteolyticus]KAH8697249.1 hypothetical protein BGW36DRAFT_378310 [Talaromyces proteolyticus]